MFESGQTIEPAELLQSFESCYIEPSQKIQEKYKYDIAFKNLITSDPEDENHLEKMKEYYLSLIDFKIALLNPEKYSAFNRTTGPTDKIEYARRKKIEDEIIASMNAAQSIIINRKMIEHKK